MAARAGFPPGLAKENWAILRALSAELSATLPFNTLAELRAKLFEAHPHLAGIDTVPENAWAKEPAGETGTGDFENAISDHFLTNPIARASTLMAELSKLAADRQTAIAAE